MDIQTRNLAAAGDVHAKWWMLGMFVVLILAIALRLYGIHNPVLDHPNWRQGDTASIARNFAALQYNLLYPQTNYDGPPPNYVELELQIVPFLAASLYKIFGVHPIFGRLISIAFSVGTVAIVGLFARWLFGSVVAGLLAAFFFAVFPGSVYYGRTFTPDATMVFFLTAALYAVCRFLFEDESLAPRALARVTALVTFAYLAKPVSLIAVVPILGVAWERLRAGRTTRPSALLVLLVIPILILALYDHKVAQHAEWHWASGITTLHVIPGFIAAFSGAGAFAHKLGQTLIAFTLLRTTMLGTIAFALTILGLIALPWINVRSKLVLWGWLAGAVAYTFVVVSVERVDYYMYVWLPLCALVIGGAGARFIAAALAARTARAARYATLALVPILALATLVTGRADVRPYYAYSKLAYRNAVALNNLLPPKALVVMGHYGPDVLYYINRYGWEEDPKLWTAFDEESAIRKGARYFISVEDNRLHANLELCAWLQRFPRLASAVTWPVYVTDPASELPGTEVFWRDFRSAESKGNGRAYLDAHHVCER